MQPPLLGCTTLQHTFFSIIRVAISWSMSTRSLDCGSGQILWEDVIYMFPSKETPWPSRIVPSTHCWNINPQVVKDMFVDYQRKPLFDVACVVDGCFQCSFKFLNMSKSIITLYSLHKCQMCRCLYRETSWSHYKNQMPRQDWACICKGRPLEGHTSQRKASTNKLKVSKLNSIVLNVCHPILQVAVFSRSIQIALPCVT